MTLILLLLALMVAMGLWEMTRHRLVRRCVPVRVHVNGSRGKSSVTRLIVEGLKAGGLRVCGKTTGSRASFMHVGGTESPIRRMGAPNIREQLRIFRLAVEERAQVLVLECMAVRPDLQRCCEHDIVHATHGVITNVRPDHLEAMGPTLDDVAESLAGTVPRKAKLFTAETRFLEGLRRRARSLGSTATACDPDSVSREDLDGFAYTEFAENVALALDVCVDLGVDRDQALRGMWTVEPDVGALNNVPLQAGNKSLNFVNAFAANDPESTLAVWRRLELDRDPARAVVLFNNRADRLRRARDLAPLFGGGIEAARIVVVGQATGQFMDLVRRRVPADTLVDAGGRDAGSILQVLAEVAPEGATVVGVGNIGGVGIELIERIEKGAA